MWMAFLVAFMFAELGVWFLLSRLAPAGEAWPSSPSNFLKDLVDPDWRSTWSDPPIHRMQSGGLG